MAQSKGFVMEGKERKGCRLKKSFKDYNKSLESSI
jgi:hypothetical protein